MANAKRDQNYVPTLLGVSNADGVTPVTVYVDPATHRMLVAMSGGTLAGLTDVTLTSVAQGDILYNNGVAWVNLPHGTSGQFLQTQGAAANPQWAPATASAAGSDKQVQFNDGGTTLAGNAGLTFTKATGNLASTLYNNITLTAPVSTATLTLGSGKTIAISNSLTLTGTDSTTMTFPTTTAIVARTDAGQTFTGTQTFSTISAPTNTSVNVNAGSYNTIQTYTPAGAGTATLDLSKGNVHHITMPAGNITIALSNTSAGQCFIVRILQDGTGSRTVTWFTTIRWAGGTAPTLTTTASKADTFGFEVTAAGTTYDGYIVGTNI